MVPIFFYIYSSHILRDANLLKYYNWTKEIRKIEDTSVLFLTRNLAMCAWYFFLIFLYGLVWIGLNGFFWYEYKDCVRLSLKYHIFPYFLSISVDSFCCCCFSLKMTIIIINIHGVMGNYFFFSVLIKYLWK